MRAGWCGVCRVWEEADEVDEVDEVEECVDMFNPNPKPTPGKSWRW